MGVFAELQDVVQHRHVDGFRGQGNFFNVGHTGDQRAFRSFLYLDPATRAAAIAVLNTDRGTDRDRPDAGAILVSLRDELLERVFPLFGPP